MIIFKFFWSATHWALTQALDWARQPDLALCGHDPLLHPALCAMDARMLADLPLADPLSQPEQPAAGFSGPPPAVHPKPCLIRQPLRLPAP